MILSFVNFTYQICSLDLKFKRAQSIKSFCVIQDYPNYSLNIDKNDNSLKKNENVNDCPLTKLKV